MTIAFTETNNGLYKTETVHRQGPWRSMQDLKMAIFGWVGWFIRRRLSDLIGNIMPEGAEGNLYAQRDMPEGSIPSPTRQMPGLNIWLW